MVRAVAGDQALKGRRIIKSRGTGEEHWRTDFLGKPGYREALKPSRKRHGVAAGITLSTEPVLMDRKEASVEPLLQDLDGSDGLGASLIRVGPGMGHSGPDPHATGGQYCLVLNGSLGLDGGKYSAWSTVFVSRDDAPLAFKAGPKGLEALLLRFPKNSSNHEVR